ncbi:hypothetical protein ETAR_19040 [Edwardsiella tarda]
MISNGINNPVEHNEANGYARSKWPPSLALPIADAASDAKREEERPQKARTKALLSNGCRRAAFSCGVPR